MRNPIIDYAFLALAGVLGILGFQFLYWLGKKGSPTEGALVLTEESPSRSTRDREPPRIRFRFSLIVCLSALFLLYLMLLVPIAIAVPKIPHSKGFLVVLVGFFATGIVYSARKGYLDWKRPERSDSSEENS